MLVLKALTDKLAARLALIWSVCPFTASRSVSQLTALSIRPNKAFAPKVICSAGSRLAGR
ncbi:hypothetical protein VAA_00202 [Vibrio anguillarum 775]|nr:hypothetical protein VAA_00202 [Vibrio anguillarum 775]